MLEELLKILHPGKTLGRMTDNFAEMLAVAREMAMTSGRIYFREAAGKKEQERLYENDRKVNSLERSIRKQVVTHLSMEGNTGDLPYCLVLMSLVGDLERIGDYAKNLSEAVDLCSGELPKDETVDELRRIRSSVEEMLADCGGIFTESDRESALALIEKGKDYAARVDRLLPRIVEQNYDSGTTAALVLGARYYKRFSGHLLNVLSGVVMPLHKLDYYDEDARAAPSGQGDTG